MGNCLFTNYTIELLDLNQTGGYNVFKFDKIDGDGNDEELFLREAASSNKVFMSPVFYYKESSGPVVQLAIMRQNYFGDEFIGILVGTLPLKTHFCDTLEEGIGKTGFYQVVDQNGVILLSAESDQIMTHIQDSGKDAHRLYDDMISLRSGFTRAVVNNIDGLVAYVPVDLVLLDMLMEPGMNGRETFEQIIKIYPGQKAVIASGFSENSEVEIAMDLGVGGFIKKPYSLEQLGRVVKDELEKSRSAAV